MESTKPTLNEAENGNKSKPLLADSGSRSCQNCKFHNKEKISCSHTYWHMCVVRDSDGYVVKYNYHHFR